MTIEAVEATADPLPLRPARLPLLRWLREGARSLAFRRPAWAGLDAGPGLLAVLVLLEMAVSIAFSRLYIDGGATFAWRTAAAGWAGLLLTAWACYLVRPARVQGDSAGAPGAAHLLALILSQWVCIAITYELITLVLLRTGAMDTAGMAVRWIVWLLPIAWGAAATLAALMRSGERGVGPRLLAACAIVLAVAVTQFLAPAPAFWTEAGDPAGADDEPLLQFDQELVEMQAPLLEEKLAALKPQRPGVADMYTITFAPYEGEEVFRRESRMVSEVMARRFDAAGRGLQLINHREHQEDMAWATPLNLERAIAGVARTMDLKEDVLFIHLTSHGARGAELAATFWPLDVAPVTPADLKRWLDEAGIRHRVVSISACYAGGWIAPLAGDDTLVMTASDADHTSYGCGRKSQLTFFGRAMYDEQLRNKTLSFEEAHAAARKVIDQREKEAGKEDGYSNPQIKVGAGIRTYLERMRARLAPG